MNRTQNVVTRIFALVLAVGATASTSAYALPHFGIHRHPGAQQNDGRITIQVTNKAHFFRDIKVDGHVYTVLPDQLLTIKAPAGTAIYADSTGGLHHKGDLLFQVNKNMQGATVTIN